MARPRRTPAAAPPVLAATGPAVMAPDPVVDRYPILMGANATLQYISNALRTCTSGYRQQFVDLLDELLERESHAQAMCGRRVQTISGGRLAFDPPTLPADHPDAEAARQIADSVREHVARIDDLPARVANLAWGDILGVAAVEAIWVQSDGFWPDRLQFIHSRRLSYPDPVTWDLHLWDQGTVTGYTFDAPTQRAGWGINITRGMPAGKFVVHTPQVRNNYPTREGLGRALVWLMAFKILGMRQGTQFIERFTKILLWGSFTTTSDGKPRAALPEDVAAGKATLESLAIGNLSASMLADAITLHMDGPAIKGSNSTLTVGDWVDLCDRQITNLLLGNSFTTDPGKNGARAAGEVGKEGEMQGLKHSADAIAATLRRDLVLPCVAQNWPGREHLAPRVKLILDKPSPGAVLDLADRGARAGLPVDADAIGAHVGLPLLAPDNTSGRRMMPVSPQGLPPLDPSARPEPAPTPLAPHAQDESGETPQDAESTDADERV